MNRAIKVIFVVALLGAAYWAAQTSATRFFAQRAPAQDRSGTAPAEAPTTGSAPSRATSATSAPATATAIVGDHLPGEAVFLSGIGLDTEALGPAIRSERFAEALDQMSDDAGSDDDAAALTQAYEDGIRAQLGPAPAVDLERIACGLRVCALRFTGGDDEHAWLAWLERFRTDPRTPHGAMLDSRVEAQPGVFERRVIFSAEPAPAR